MAKKVLAATLVEPKRMEVREYDMPEIGPDEGLLKVERCGVCGSDVHGWESMRRGVRILGHENLGYIAKIGRNAAQRWGVKEGDRVALEEYVPCGVCSICRSGDYRFCPQTDIGLGPDTLWYGSTSVSTQPALWGGYSQYLYLHANAVVHKVPESVPADEAAFFLPFSNGFEWACNYGGAHLGKVVLVQGPGQQGLASVIAAKEVGAACIVVSGITKDKERLRVARELGANYTVNVEEENLVERVMGITGGYGADVVVNVSGAEGTIAESMALIALNGTIVLGGVGNQQIPTAAVGRKNLAIKWAHGHSYRSVEMAIQTIASGKYPVGLVTTHHFGLSQADVAIKSVAGEGEPGAIHVSIDPWAPLP
ncbi:MAG: zinc-binding dehydrogenase [Nitrospirales bacterium]